MINHLLIFLSKNCINLHYQYIQDRGGVVTVLILNRGAVIPVYDGVFGFLLKWNLYWRGVEMETRPLCNSGFILCYEKYFTQVMRYIMKYVSNYHDTEEIAQDVFMRVYEKGEGLDPESGRIKNFIFTIARNKAIDFIKNRKKEMDKLQEAYFEEAVLDDMFFRDIEDLYIEGELVSTLQETLYSFTERERAVYLESEYKSKKHVIVSSEMNISPYKLKKLIKSMNFVLRDKITPYR
jgi:RNA polymerase sigma factor (sigma-70 family)